MATHNRATTLKVREQSCTTAPCARCTGTTVTGLQEDLGTGSGVHVKAFEEGADTMALVVRAASSSC
ncbi:hypothetical protein CesoFtcFv8_018016 [Champsocephalus esox]|uniref:Uncharacterized protein n=2 Tax=Champsocephalus TaxID=52236 RepID=A0AAN8D6D7_CHAGU|nr:hypothetical protein CesoFtcFv8_018016 [Champsocephalus esox]KAK5917501.1 hypothetical protein CgunFtcFv8_012386 [Champsocephalus gunnari]